MSELGGSRAESTRFPRQWLLLVLLMQSSSGRSTALIFRLRLVRETPKYRIRRLAYVCEGYGEGKSCEAALG
ncbi:hypothetical protein DFH94DRAFT_707441 [Russula ochroleuca]|uniref:Uncharacterized protein n=1 Tax=Russula ochroleuca TaxID=152965 RepID=A0A9P5N3V7_9AGAM|nr:hypothetical protein DFH94DRAFT_707441 [Russula ochroleuca]